MSTAKFHVFRPKLECRHISAKLSRTSTSILSQNVYTGEGKANCLQASEMHLCQRRFAAESRSSKLFGGNEILHYQNVLKSLK